MQQQGASGHYIREDAPVIKSQQQNLAISVGQPGGEVTTSKYNWDLKIKPPKQCAKRTCVTRVAHIITLGG
eukprot:438214-Ditylum_brightwellii.AAC.1